ncbi:MAG: permease-like cell division protein FtsX [Thiohalomonadales bacterium]
MRVYFVQHLWVSLTTLGQLCRNPFSTSLTSAVIAIALALPAGLFVFVNSMQQLTTHWQTNNQISVFMRYQTEQRQVLALKNKLLGWPEIESVRYISPQQGLEDFKQYSGLGDVLNKLDNNPLPAVLTVIPRAELNQPQKIAPLLTKIRTQANVDMLKVDMEWLQRLESIIKIGRLAAAILAGLLAIAILLIVGNTLRLTIYNHRQEILVSKLIGATTPFIRRPFLYVGFWYGLFAALTAWLILQLILALLNTPVAQLAELYQSQFQIKGLDFVNSLFLISFSIFLGVFGAWLAVTRHLRTIEPR